MGAAQPLTLPELERRERTETPAVGAGDGNERAARGAAASVRRFVGHGW